MTSLVTLNLMLCHKTSEDVLIALNMKFNQNRSVRARDIDFFSLNRRHYYVFKPEVDNQTHKMICIFLIRRSCCLQKYISFLNRRKFEKICKKKTCNFFSISACHSDIQCLVISCKNHAATNRIEIIMDNNQ